MDGRRSKRRTDRSTRRRARTLLRYWLMQLPGTALLVVALLLLRHWFEMPVWVIVAALVVWVIKDAVLYPFLKHAFDPTLGAQPHSPLGRTAVAREGLGVEHPEGDGSPRPGYVQLGGELWQAELAPDAAPVAPGGRVRVVDQRGLRLVVEPVSAHASGAERDTKK